MKIKDLIAKTPEVSEEKLLEYIDKLIPVVKNVDLLKRIETLHPLVKLNQAFLDEYDLIQVKESKLTKSQRDSVLGFVSFCMIQMVKANGKSRSNDTLGTIPEIEEVRDNPESE